MSNTARDMWTLYEPIHAVTYFTPQARAAYEAAGLRGFWRGYFAGRAAPLGPVGPEPVLELFHGFAPAMVSRALPDVWQRATPQAALDARQAGAVDALSELVDDSPLDEAAELLDAALVDLDVDGRPLGAANAALPRPDGPARRAALGRLWQAATTLREHRGDGHVAALRGAGLDGCESLALRAGQDVPREILQPARGWTDEEWAQAQDRLRERGYLDQTGRATAAGAAAYQAVEEATDAAADGPWGTLGEEGTVRLRSVLAPITRCCFGSLPIPNPIGMTAPAQG